MKPKDNYDYFAETEKAAREQTVRELERKVRDLEAEAERQKRRDGFQVVRNPYHR